MYCLDEQLCNDFNNFVFEMLSKRCAKPSAQSTKNFLVELLKDIQKK